MSNLHHDMYQLTSLLQQTDNNTVCSYFIYYKKNDLENRIVPGMKM